MIQLNFQPIEKQEIVEDGSLDIQEIYYTIQGEGPFTGMPAVFVRLAGCNLQCQYCDTDYTSRRKRFTLDEVHDKIWEYDPKLAVFTGGEPFRQNIEPIIERLLNPGFRVQIETNGTLYLDLPYSHPNLCVVCSPKTPTLNKSLEGWISDYKYVLNAEAVCEQDGLPNSVLGKDIVPARPARMYHLKKDHIWIQPEESSSVVQTNQNIQAAVKSCMIHGYRLSLQTHKIIGLP